MQTKKTPKMEKCKPKKYIKMEKCKPKKYAKMEKCKLTRAFICSGNIK